MVPNEWHQSRREVCAPGSCDDMYSSNWVFRINDRSRVRITSVKFLQRERQLNEMKIVEPQARREAGEHQIPTVAPGDRNDGMIQELLKELEELDKPHELSEDDEAMIDALLQ